MSSHEVQEVGISRSVEEISNFMGAHSNLLKDGTLRAVCAIGIAAGILLEVQRQTRPSMPFWGRLNRLEMDLERTRRLFPEILNKLNQYDERRYDDVLAYLGREEISRLDLNQRNLPREVISLVFAVGMSEGHHIASRKRG